MENKNVTDMEINSVKTLWLKCEKVRVLQLYNISHIADEDMFMNLEYVKLCNMKVDVISYVLLVCPKIREIMFVNPEEVINMNMGVWPETLEAVCIVAKAFHMDEDDFDSITHVNLVKALCLGGGGWSISSVVLRTGRFLTENIGRFRDTFLLKY
jgi:hypothetical protein